MQLDDVRRWRRRAQYHLRVRRWPLQRKIAVGAWIPVLVVGLALFTGPNRSKAASRAAPVTTTTEFHMAQLPATPGTVNSSRSAAQDDAISAWIAALPPKKTLPQGIAVARFRAIRDRTILALHYATERANTERVHQNDKAIMGR